MLFLTYTDPTTSSGSAPMSATAFFTRQIVDGLRLVVRTFTDSFDQAYPCTYMTHNNENQKKERRMLVADRIAYIVMPNTSWLNDEYTVHHDPSPPHSCSQETMSTAVLWHGLMDSPNDNTERIINTH